MLFCSVASISVRNSEWLKLSSSSSWLERMLVIIVFARKGDPIEVPPPLFENYFKLPFFLLLEPPPCTLLVLGVSLEERGPPLTEPTDRYFEGYGENKCVILAVSCYSLIRLSCFLRVSICSAYCLSRVSLGSSLTLGWFLMRLALSAYLKVDKVSSYEDEDGEMFAIMHVFTLPPKESCKSLVSLESRYGTCLLLPSTSDVITFIRADSERLILVASLNLTPVDPVRFCFSDPAKSTRLSLPMRIVYSFLVSTCLLLTAVSTKMVKMQCDLLESLFIRVSPVALALLPSAKALTSSPTLLQMRTWASWTLTPSFVSLISSRFLITSEATPNTKV